MWEHLNRQGITVARCTVERLMRAHGWWWGPGARRGAPPPPRGPPPPRPRTYYRWRDERGLTHVAELPPPDGTVYSTIRALD
jgi:transposase InsO family protein